MKKEPELLKQTSVGGCTACHMFAVFPVNRSHLYMLSHTSDSLSAAIGGVTAVVQLRKSAAMDLSR